MNKVRPVSMCMLILLSASSLFAATSALVISSSSQLLNGADAAGQIGDVLLANGEISVVISSISHPYGYANTGGYIIDGALTSNKTDAFGQLYVYLNDAWPRQANYTTLGIVDSGAGGGPARVRASGVDSGNSSIAIVTDYVLADGATAVTIASTVTNNTGATLSSYELGDATEWKSLDVFAPGYGFDVSGTTYQTWMAAVSGNLVYGYYGTGAQMWGPNGNGWSDINIKTVNINNGSYAAYTRYFQVASGDVAAISDGAHAIAGLTVGTLDGSVTVADTGAPIAGATIDVYDDGGSFYTQMITDAAGLASATVAPGSWRLVASTSYGSTEQWYTVNASATTNFDFLMGGGSTGYALGDVLTVIQRPLLNIPTIVENGGSFVINCLADPATTGWAASLQHGSTEVLLTVDSAAYNSGTTWWDLTVDLPNVDLLELYDLRVTANGGLDDTSHSAVQVIANERMDFYFLHVTDTHLPTHMFYYEAGSETDTTEVEDLRAIIKDAEIINPAFVLHTGDLINEGELEDFEERRYYSRSQQLLGEFTVPLYLIAGNHDIGGWDDTPPSDGTSRRDWWRFFGWSILDNPPAGAPLYTQNYSFTYGGVHFTALEAYDNYDMWRSNIYGADSFTSGQMSWLSGDLAAASGTLAQVLFYHYDFSNQINLSSLGVELALWGHIHSNSGSLSSPPYDLATDQVCDGGRSYRLIRVSNGVITPRATLSAGSSGQNLRVGFSPSNTGAADSVVATIVNNQPERFQYGRVIFEMPNTPIGIPGTSIDVEGGTLAQIDYSGETARWYVDVDLAAYSTTVVTAKIVHLSAAPAVPGRLVLRPNHPNPFNPRTTLSYDLPRDEHVRVAILDLRGREVALLVDAVQDAGEQSVIWDGLDRTGRAAPSGTYIVHIRTASEARTAKITLAR